MDFYALQNSFPNHFFQTIERMNVLLRSIGLFAVAMTAARSIADEKQQPNVLFIAIDDLNDWV